MCAAGDTFAMGLEHGSESYIPSGLTKMYAVSTIDHDHPTRITRTGQRHRQRVVGVHRLWQGPHEDDRHVARRVSTDGHPVSLL